MDVNKYKPSFEAKQFLEEANKLERFYAPSPLPPSRRKSSYKKKPKKKQLKIEKAVKNMTKPPTNFQGVPLDKCTYVSELDKHVFIHKDYEKAWKKVQKEPLFYSLPNDGEFCPDCLLKPCSTRVLGNKLEYDACTVKELAEMTEEEYREKLRRYYRAQLVKLQGKRIISRQMPSNEHIPVCAKQLTAKIASIEAGGYDCLLDEPSPFQPLLKANSKSSTSKEELSDSEEEACF